ncbi:hypothetical protein ES703_32003 [subsurface metagenome]
MNPAVPQDGDDVLLQQYLDSIGYRLKDALRPGAIGPLANLESPYASPLNVDKGHYHHQYKGGEDGEGDDYGYEICCPIRQVVEQPILELLKNSH